MSSSNYQFVQYENSNRGFRMFWLTSKGRSAEVRECFIPLPDFFNIFTMELEAALLEQRSYTVHHHPKSNEAPVSPSQILSHDQKQIQSTLISTTGFAILLILEVCCCWWMQTSLFTTSCGVCLQIEEWQLYLHSKAPDFDTPKLVWMTDL